MTYYHQLEEIAEAILLNTNKYPEYPVRFTTADSELVD